MGASSKGHLISLSPIFGEGKKENPQKGGSYYMTETMNQILFLMNRIGLEYNMDIFCKYGNNETK